jgi:hypothetical protein
MAELNGTKLEKIPIHLQLGDNMIDGAVVKPLTFKQFSDYINEAQAMKQPDAFDARMRRVRLSKQVAYYINGTVVPVTMTDILKLPIGDSRKILAKLDTEEGKSGKIIRDGNGIDNAITYELGTPIETGSGKPPIRELEFFAQTYGDIEDILSADNAIAQTAVMIAKMGKPLGTSLSALPSWAINLITVTDGITISRDILPRFLGSPDE